MEIQDILVSIGIEILLNGIILKKDPDKFFEGNTRKSPSFKDSINFVMSVLPEKFDSEQRKRINLILRLIKKRRNNLVHLGFHKERGDYEGPMYEVLQFLFTYFTDYKPDIVDFIENRLEKIRQDRPSYKSINLSY